MSFELYINGQLVDPPLGAEVVSSFSTNNLGDIATRNGIYSNTFTLPYTNKNRLIFGNAEEVLSGSDVPYERLDAVIKDQGVYQVIGFAELITAKRKTGYKINVVGGNANWMNDIGNKTMNLLRFPALNHKWEDANVYNRRQTDWEDGVNYPNADYGNFTSTVSTNVDYTDLFAGVYAKHIVKKLFQDAGKTLTGNWWNNNATFAKQFIPFCALWKRDTDYASRSFFSAVYNNNVTATDPTYISLAPELHNGNVTTTPVGQYDFVPSLDYLFDPFPTINGVSQNFHWLILEGGEITVNYNLTLKVLTNPPNILNKCTFVYLDENGSVANVSIADLSAAALNSVHNVTGSFTVNASRGPVWFAIGQLQMNAGSAFDLTLVANENDDDLYIDETFSWITIGSTLPEVECLDLLRTIWNQYGIILAEDSQTNVINIFTLDEVQASITNAEDWSDKIDLAEEPEVSYRLEGYAQTNYFRYLSDDIDEFLLADPFYGQGILSINNNNLELELEIFVSAFAPVKRISSFDGARIMGYIPKFIDGEEQDVVPRMCYIEFDDDNQITIGANALEANQPNLYFEDLIFDNLLDLYYTTLVSILNNTKIVDCLMRLKAVDIANLDFSRAKYISHFDCYFWLNDVPQYNFTNPQSTKINIIRI